MSRKYSKRVKSTKSKSYEDYLNMRKELESKGYVLKEQMSRRSFESYYDRLKEAKRSGEIKSQPWQYLKSKESYLSEEQAKALSKASKEMVAKGLASNSFTKDQIKKMATSQTIYNIGIFLNANKESLFSGNYE